VLARPFIGKRAPPVRTPDNTTTVRALQRAAKGTSNEARGIYVNRSMYSRTFER
jgi:hypothetical protein